MRVEGGREVDSFSALVDPGIPIPAMITGITGIDDETVAGAPPIEIVLPRFVDFAAHSVLVAHNARFDLGFLDYELAGSVARPSRGRRSTRCAWRASSARSSAAR